MVKRSQILSAVILSLILGVAKGQTTNTFPLSGSVGIGTTNPSAKLDVEGGWIVGSGGVYNDSANQSGMNTPGNGALSFRSAGNDGMMVISNKGNVGIHTLSPNNLFEINGGAFSFFNPGNWTAVGMDYDPTGDTLRFRSNVSSTNLNQTDVVIQRTTGNVGIGTAVPSAILTIRKDAGTGNPMSTPAAMIDFKAYYSGYDTETVKASIRSGVDGTAVWNTQSGFLAFDTANAGALNEALRISATGNVGIGTPGPTYKLDVAGQVRAQGGVVFPDGNIQSVAWTGSLCGGDYAESVNVSDDRTNYEPGDVLVIDSKVPGKFLKSIEPYSTLVMGIYSTKPGVIGRRQATPKGADEVPMAMIGIVPTKVSAENGPIAPGDLLVSSSTPGYAMKGTDRSRMFGAVLGKALGSLDTGKGVIEVGVTLQ